MIDIQLGEVTHQFMEMIWANEPIRSTRLVHMAEETLHWKKPTTYTVIRRLCEKGIIKNEESTVSALISREDFFIPRSFLYIIVNKLSTYKQKSQRDHQSRYFYP